jgi:hypothetical protein
LGGCSAGCYSGNPRGIVFRYFHSENRPKSRYLNTSQIHYLIIVMIKPLPSSFHSRSQRVCRTSRLLEFIKSRRSWTHLIRFIAEEDNQIHLGNIDASKYPDIGLSMYNGDAVEAQLVTGSVFSGTVTNKWMHVKRVSISGRC